MHLSDVHVAETSHFVDSVERTVADQVALATKVAANAEQIVRTIEQTGDGTKLASQVAATVRAKCEAGREQNRLAAESARVVAAGVVDAAYLIDALRTQSEQANTAAVLVEEIAAKTPPAFQSGAVTAFGKSRALTCTTGLSLLALM